MEKKVEVFAKYEFYDGYIRGFKFTNGKAMVPESDAAKMAEEFGVTYAASEVSEPVEEPKQKKAPKAKKKNAKGE